MQMSTDMNSVEVFFGPPNALDHFFPFTYHFPTPTPHDQCHEESAWELKATCEHIV